MKNKKVINYSPSISDIRNEINSIMDKYIYKKEIHCDKNFIPKVSIILICLNASLTISRALKSISGQKYKNYELIVIDGGSNDSTLSILELNKEFIDIIISHPDKGISDAFNRGISVASGEYIAFHNADDMWPVEHLDTCIDILQSNKTASFVYGDLIRYDETNGNIYQLNADLYKKNSFLMSWAPIFNHPTFVTRYKIFENYGLFNTEYSICMDLDWLIRVLKKGEIGIYSNNVWVIMYHGGVSDNPFKMYKEVKKILLKYGNKYHCVYAMYILSMLKLLMKSSLLLIINYEKLIFIKSRLFKNINTLKSEKIIEIKKIINNFS